MGALRTYHEGGHYGDGIHHLYATVLRGRRLVPTSAINVVTTPSTESWTLMSEWMQRRKNHQR